MAITPVITPSLSGYAAGYGQSIGTIAGPNPYVAGGFAADIVADLSLASVSAAVVSASGGYLAAWDSAAKKIIAYSTAATEVVGGVDLSGIVFTVVAFE